ncbi:MAG: hypothetical protein ACI4MR_08460 [Candidatus Aphodomorpha sp.]
MLFYERPFHGGGFASGGFVSGGFASCGFASGMQWFDLQEHNGQAAERQAMASFTGARAARVALQRQNGRRQGSG